MLRAPAHELQRILSALAVATRPGELDNPAWRLHPQKGELAGHWSIRVTNNWRVTFRFEEGETIEINLIDYH